MKTFLAIAAALGLSVSAASADCAYHHSKVSASVDTQTTTASVEKADMACKQQGFLQTTVWVISIGIAFYFNTAHAFDAPEFKVGTEAYGHRVEYNAAAAGRSINDVRAFLKKAFSG